MHIVMYESIAYFLAAVAGASQAPLLPSSVQPAPTELQQVVQRTLPNPAAQAGLKPFLTLPMQKQAGDISPNEGWYYSPEEMLIHDKALHRGIDWSVERGTPVVAAADGYAVRSFQLAATNEKYQGKTVGFSLGEFVEIWHPEQKVYTLYGHLERAADSINYVTSVQVDADTWEPNGIYVDTATFMSLATQVKRGDVIGYAGDSGIGWGYNDIFLSKLGHVLPRDIEEKPSWDETHVHFEVYTRTPDGRNKAERFDPYGHYDYIDKDRNPYAAAPEPKKSLWLLDTNGKPKYAE